MIWIIIQFLPDRFHLIFLLIVVCQHQIERFAFSVSSIYLSNLMINIHKREIYEEIKSNDNCKI
jgi:hypothetical protein